MGKGLKLLAIPFAILMTATIAPATEFHLYFLKALQQAKADEDIDGDGEPDKLIPTGIAWIQGKAMPTMDAKSPIAIEAT